MSLARNGHEIKMIGHLGRDPEMRYTPDGREMTRFSLATNRKYNGSNGERVDVTVWGNITAWGKMGEVCNQYLQKGSQVLVEGYLTPDRATGAPRLWVGNDGQSRASFEITATAVRFLAKTKGGQHDGQQVEGNADDADMLPPEDDLPY